MRAAALRTFITAFTPPVSGVAPSKSTQDAYNAISKVLIPRLVGYVVTAQASKSHPAPPPGMLEVSPKTGADGDAIDVLIEVVRCFGPMLQDVEKQALQKSILTILDNERTGIVIKKKAVTAMSTLAMYLPDRLLSSFVSSTIQGFRGAQVTTHKQRLLITVVGSLARSVPQRLGPQLKKLAPFVLDALSHERYQEYKEELAETGASNPEAEEVFGAALTALEGFLACCSHEMRAYTGEAIQAALRYVAFDPNMAEEDEDMGGTQHDSDEDLEQNASDEEEEQDYEEEAGMSDDDDMSWKVRRCAAKVLYVIVSTRSNGDLLDNGVLYDKIAPTLIKRFQEREENVRLEILAALDLLINKTGQVIPGSRSEKADAEALNPEPSRSRKRRRASTTENDFESQGPIQVPMGVNSPVPSPPPASGPKADLARSRPAIIQGIIKILKQGSAPTKQAGLHLLRELSLVQSSGLSDHLTNVIDPLVDAIGLPTGSASFAVAGAGNQLRIDALRLVGTICDTHPSRIIAPYLGKLIPKIIAAAVEKTLKVSSQALSTVESLVRVLTPPRSASTQQQYRSYIGNLYDTIIDRATTTDADLEVRQRAIQAVGILLARTSGGANTKLLPPNSRAKALGVLLDRMRNETTRLAAAQAIDLAAVSLTEKDNIQKTWVREVVLELAAQFRKSDRAIKSASLIALRNLAGNRAAISCLDATTIRTLSGMLLPVIDISDLNTLGLALVIATKLVQSSPKTIVDDNLNRILCTVAVAPLSGAVLETFLALVKAIGEADVGQPLMKGLLKDGITGDPAIAGKAIGTLLIAGGPNVGVTIDAFVKELETTEDDIRKCLALYILGEAGLRLGTDSPLDPKVFSKYFTSRSETVPRAAAAAFGRAGAGNVDVYLPAILSNAKKSGNAQYLSLHAIKEILQYVGRSEVNISPYIRDVWDRLLSATKAEDNKAIGAECIGRIMVIEPKTFLPIIQVSFHVFLSLEDPTDFAFWKNLLRNPDVTTRGMVIQATRFTFADADESFDEVLKPLLSTMLITMLNDTSMENRRLALSTLDSAIRNKPEFVLPDLSQLVPLVLNESKVKPELIREVQMGPFKHKVDDGLEVRKASSWRWLFSLMPLTYKYDRVPTKPFMP